MNWEGGYLAEPPQYWNWNELLPTWTSCRFAKSGDKGSITRDKERRGNLGYFWYFSRTDSQSVDQSHFKIGRLLGVFALYLYFHWASFYDRYQIGWWCIWPPDRHSRCAASLAFWRSGRQGGGISWLPTLLSNFHNLFWGFHKNSEVSDGARELSDIVVCLLCWRRRRERGSRLVGISLNGITFCHLKPWSGQFVMDKLLNIKTLKLLNIDINSIWKRIKLFLQSSKWWS